MSEFLRALFQGQVAAGASKPRTPLGRSPALANRIRGWLLTGVVTAALFGLVRLFQGQVPIQHWFVWRYFLYWAVTLVWSASCFSCGYGITQRVLCSPLPVLEQITMSFAVGVLAFFSLMYIGGLLQLFGPAFFVALPLFMIASGARSSLVYLRRLRRGLSAARARLPQRPWSSSRTALWALGLIALFLFYVPALVPSHISYDGAWYHVPLGEHYARLGRIEKLPEGWFPGAMPHLPSIVYCFAFLLPQGTLFDFVELCAHLEFAGMLMMLPGIPALVRRLAPGARALVSWIAFFAFPGVYWYDLLIGGDQFSALWSVPICLALLRTLPDLSWRHGLLLACGVAGEALTKYSASGVLAGPAVAVALRMLWLGARALWQRRSLVAGARAVYGGVVVGAAVLLLTTPLWLKNWIWYGDPFYPLLYRHLHLRPWSADAAVDFRDFTRGMGNWQPPPGLAGVEQSFLAMFKHAFEPADFSAGSYRGALFTLMCACIPLVRGPWRLWCTAAVLHVGIFCWFLQMHQDRYLLAFIPAMAAVAVAVAVQVWRTSLAARLSLSALFAFHTVWSLGVFGLGAPVSHYRNVLDFATAVSAGTQDAGMGDLARWNRFGQALPPEAKVLVHSWHAHTGLAHPSVSDWVGFEGGISYGRLDSAAAVYRTLRELRVTHLVWQDNHGDDSFAGDLRFFEFATLYTAPRQQDGLWIGVMPKVSPPPATKPQLIAFLSCNDRYQAGLYPFSAMTVPNPSNLPQPHYPSPLSAITPENEPALLEQARYAVLNPACGFQTPSSAQGFVHIGQRDDYALFARADLP